MIKKLEEDDMEALKSWDINWSILQVRDILPGPGRPPKEERLKEAYKRRKGMLSGFSVDRESSI